MDHMRKGTQPGWARLSVLDEAMKCCMGFIDDVNGFLTIPETANRLVFCDHAVGYP
jgi:hypothetical protein